jgi:outer membrane protein assembly factor BamA
VIALVLTAIVAAAAGGAEVLAVQASGANPGAALQAASTAGERITEITVHGNVLSTDDDIRRLAGLEIGMAVGPSTVEEAANRLKATKKFETVDVRKRYASIADPTQIVVVIVVDEGAVHLESLGDDGPPQVVKSRFRQVMFLPIFSAEDGYGLSYGVRFAVVNKLGPQSRISFPLSWGGERQAAVEIDKQLDSPKLTRFTGGVGISERTNPFYELSDTRNRIWARAEHELVKGLRAGVTGTWQHVSFGGLPDQFASAQADITLDTRLDPMLARNAVYVRAAFEHVAFGNEPPANLTSLDARGYIGLIGQTVLVVRLLRENSDTTLPPYMKVLFGGNWTVRGFRAGSAVGDNDVAGTLELLVPLTSPLHIARLGVSAFMDAGAVYDVGQHLGDQPIWRGVGGSVWMTATFIRFSVAVAHGIGASTRVHVGGSVSF